MKLNLLVMLSVFAVLFSACEKQVEEEQEEKELGKAEMLAGNSNKTWKLSQYEWGGMIMNISACHDDNKYIYSADGDYLFIEGSETCKGDKELNETPSGSWELTDNGSTITFTDTEGETQVWTIDYMFEDEMLLKTSTEMRKYVHGE